MGFPEILAGIEPYKLFYDGLQFSTGQQIMEIMQKKGITEEKLAKMTGINRGRVITMLAGDQTFSHLMLAKICTALGCDCKITITEKKDGSADNCVQPTQ